VQTANARSRREVLARVSWKEKAVSRSQKKAAAPGEERPPDAADLLGDRGVGSAVNLTPGMLGRPKIHSYLPQH